MRVLLTFPPATNDLDSFKGINRQTSTAIYLLAEVLRANDINVKVVDPVSYYEEGTELLSMSFVQRLIENIDIVTISSNTFNWHSAKKLIATIRKIDKDIPIVLGGVHPTIMDSYVLKTTGADVVARKEGEITLIELIKGISNKGVNNLYDIEGITFKDSLGQIIKNKDRIPLSEKNYNEVVLPSFNEMPEGFYVGIPCETSRGCLYNCAFCGIMHHNSWKCLNIENSIRQIDNSINWATKKCTSPMVFLGDDCISVNKERMIGIFKYLAGRNDRFNVFMEGRLGDLQDANVADVMPVDKIMRFLVGIESGYDEGLKMVRKGYNIEVINRIFSQYKGKKFLDSIFCTFIIGLPWESYDECIKTIQFAAHLYEDFGIKSNIGWWSAIPSYLWDVRKQYGINVDESIFDNADWCSIDTTNPETIFMKTHPKITQKDFIKIEKIINLYSNSGVKIIDS